jgi:hypothetical protein
MSRDSCIRHNARASLWQSEEVGAIIDGHDPRETPLSLNDRLVKDADKLCRFTPIGRGTDQKRFGFTKEEHRAWLGERIDRWFFTAEGRRIARNIWLRSSPLVMSRIEFPGYPKATIEPAWLQRRIGAPSGFLYSSSSKPKPSRRGTVIGSQVMAL